MIPWDESRNSEARPGFATLERQQQSQVAAGCRSCSPSPAESAESGSFPTGADTSAPPSQPEKAQPSKNIFCQHRRSQDPSNPQPWGRGLAGCHALGCSALL